MPRCGVTPTDSCLVYQRRKKMKYKAIIFDMDGTIVDTEQIWHLSTRKLITNRGITLSEELLVELESKLNGMALPQSCQLIKDTVNLSEPIEELMIENTRLACNLYSSETIKFIDGFVEFHQQVRTLNLKTSIATNANDETLRITNQFLQLEQFFGSHIYNLSHVNNMGKPNPALYLHAAKQLEIDPTECIAIEDSAHGIAAARAAGMFCIGINTSHKPEQIKDADLKINGYHEIRLLDLVQINNK